MGRGHAPGKILQNHTKRYANTQISPKNTYLHLKIRIPFIHFLFFRSEAGSWYSGPPPSASVRGYKRQVAVTHSAHASTVVLVVYNIRISSGQKLFVSE